MLYWQSMQAILHFFSHLGNWRVAKWHERKRLERKVTAGTKRAIKEYRVTFERLKEFDKQ